MEELLYLLGFFIVGAFVIVPIVLLAKISSTKRGIDSLTKDVKELDNKLHFLLNNAATKYDLSQMEVKTSRPSEDKVPEPMIEDPIVTIPPVVSEEVEKEDPIEEPIINMIEEEPQVEVTQEPILEETIESIHVEEEIVPAYAAVIKPVEEEVVTTEPFVTPVAMQNVQDGEPEKGLVEKVFGGNLLAKIGIVTLVLGIGFFVKYAIDQGWINEVGRVAIGLATGGIIIGIAHKLKEKYNVFSSILVGGGISVFYVTITLAFREYEIFSQPVAFVLLTMITVFSVILSLLYNRQELAIFSLVGGVLAPLMISTGEGNYIVLFSYLLILNTGMLVISLKKSWNLIGIIAYVFSMLFFWAWLLFKFETEYLGATVFASLFFVQFYLLAIIKHFREGKKMTIFQAILILTNNLSILFACMYVFNNYTPDLRGIATIVIAVVNAVVMMTLFRQSKVDKNMIYLIIAVVMSFVSLAVPIQLRGYVITMFWAAESILLLWLWQKSKINVFRLGFLAISLLAIISYIMDVEYNYNYGYGIESVTLSMFSNRIFITGVVVLISYAINLFLLSKERKEEDVTVKGSNILSISNLVLLFRFMFVALLFFVPYLELNYQLEAHTDVNYTSSFRDLSLATYATLFIAGLSIIFKDKIRTTGYYLFLSSVALYALFYSFMVIELREDIYRFDVYSKGYFLIHFLALPAIACIIYVLVKNIKMMSEAIFKVLCWTLFILSVIILSVELDNVVIAMLGNADNYYSILYDVHTFGYPILWGLMAMALMIWGLKKKEVTLRIISLISFGLIIAKFYAYDVWHMSQAGLIISLVILGVILLIVSFMQQKIKTLVKEDEETPIEQEEKEI